MQGIIIDSRFLTTSFQGSCIQFVCTSQLLIFDITWLALMTFLTFYAPYYVLPLTHKTMREGMKIESDQEKKSFTQITSKHSMGLIIWLCSNYQSIIRLWNLQCAPSINTFLIDYDLKGKSIFSNQNLYIKMWNRPSVGKYQKKVEWRLKVKYWRPIVLSKRVKRHTCCWLW